MVRLALLGGGRIGKVHAAAIAAAPDAELVRVYDPIEPAAVALAEQYGAAASTDPDAVLADPFQPPVRPVLRRDPRTGPDRRDRPARTTGHHQPRPRPGTGRLPGRVGWAVPRHDHPRLRHGRVLPRRRGRGTGDGRQPGGRLHR